MPNEPLLCSDMRSRHAEGERERERERERRMGGVEMASAAMKYILSFMGIGSDITNLFWGLDMQTHTG
jgi:hypothetical protein